MHTVASEEISNRLFQLYEQTEMRSFLNAGGELHIAIEKKPLEWIDELLGAGQRQFSEKHVQGTVYKHLLFQSVDVKLNLYGHLQRNKVKRAVACFDRIESIDSIRLADRLKRCIDNSQKVRLKEVLVQVNQGREPQKTGVLPEHAQGLIDHCLGLGLPLVGLMSIPPRNQNPAPYFKVLRKMADRNGLEHCQMGMSDDWQIAIKCGATRIRLGRAIFGSKDKW